ncbi:MAG: serine/threonine-protein kinase [Acidimicrobiales bacterium]
MTTLRPHTEIAERYELQERLSGGPLGEVWHAVDTTLKRPVALKLVNAELAQHESFRDVFRREARAWAGISHPGTAWVFDFGEQVESEGPPLVYLVMELVDGRGIDAVVERVHRLSPAQTLDVVAQAASTLHAAHGRGLVHGNVKPSNLLLRSDGVLKVTDFGIGRAADALPLSDVEVVLNSAAYRSPEQAAGITPTTASDLYSLGIIAYQCLTGVLPFAADGPVGASVEHLTEQPRRMPADIPDSVCAFVETMLVKDPKVRPFDAGELALQAVTLCRRLGSRTTRPLRELLGGDVIRLV